MRWVASLLRWTWIFLVGAGVCLVQVLLSPALLNPWIDPRRRGMEWLNHLWAKGTLLAFPGIHLEVFGHERLTAGGPYVLCANHQSAADIIMLLAAWPHMKFIAKRSLFLVPPIGWSMWLAGYVIAGTGEPKSSRRAMDQAVGWLRRGCHVLTFPEGTRSPDGRLLRFRQGAFVLAREAGTKVVPVAISGTRALLEKRAFAFHPAGDVRIDFLEPQDVETDAKRAASKMRATIDAALASGAKGVS
jgi:1-acyl-sn-glycerol-3-phosphate acyltransferase